MNLQEELVNEIFEWLENGGFIGGVHYDEASILARIEEVLGYRPAADEEHP